MASETWRLLDPRVHGADDVQTLDLAFGGGAYSKLEIHVRILKSGSAGNIKLQHAAVNEEDAYIDLGTATWAVTGTGSHISVSSFLRYIRWVCDGSVAGTPVIMIDIVAKE